MICYENRNISCKMQKKGKNKATEQNVKIRGEKLISDTKSCI